MSKHCTCHKEAARVCLFGCFFNKYLLPLMANKVVCVCVCFSVVSFNSRSRAHCYLNCRNRIENLKDYLSHTESRTLNKW